MFTLNIETHVLTFVFVLLELMMFSYQLIYYFSRPDDQTRLWYLILLALLILYNMSGGAGFVIAAYFPFYFYKCFKLKKLKQHALYLAPVLLVFPFFICLLIVYPMLEDLHLALKYGMLIPFLYAPVLLFAIGRAITDKLKKKKNTSHADRKLEMLAVYLAVVPWALLPVFAYVDVAPWIEVLVTNLGFVGITILFMVRAALSSREEYEQLRAMLASDAQQRTDFLINCLKYLLTKRETEIALLLCQGLTYKEIAGLLFRSEHTIETHVHNIFMKTGVKRKMELLPILGFGAGLVTRYALQEAE